MKRLGILVLLAFASLHFGCSNSTTQPQESLTVRTLLTNLEYPKGLWVKNNKVYFTESNGRSTIYGGKNALSVYDPGTNMKTVLRNPLVNTEGVIVTDDRVIYLTSWHGGVPGDIGEVSYIDTLTLVETHVADITIASVDMYVDSNDDIYVIGSSDNPSANSVIRLPVGDYTNPEVVYQSLGRATCFSLRNSALYYSDDSAIRRFTGSLFELFVSKSVSSMSFSSKYLFYADSPGGKIGKINVSTKADETLVTALHSPTAVRWDSAHSRLYFLEAGTDANEFKDGALKVVTGIR